MAARDSWLRKSGFVIGASAMTLVLLASSLVTILYLNVALRQHQQANTTLATLMTVDDFRASVTEAEAGVDDYVMSGGVTGQPLYQDARARVVADARQLTATQGTSASLKLDVAQVQRLTPVYLTNLQDAIALSQAGQTGEAMRLISTGVVAQEVHVAARRHCADSDR